MRRSNTKEMDWRPQLLFYVSLNLFYPIFFSLWKRPEAPENTQGNFNNTKLLN